MTRADGDKVFSGSIPKLYETYLVPLIFEPYADDLAKRVALRAPKRVLEIAAGTGVVTRRLAAALDETASIVATDLNQPMLDHASLDRHSAVLSHGVRPMRCSFRSATPRSMQSCASSA